MPESEVFGLVFHHCGWICGLVFRRCGRICGFVFDFPSDPLVFSSVDLLVSVGGICHFYLYHCGWQTTSSPDHCLTISFPARLTFGFYIGAVYIFFLHYCGRCLLLAFAVADGHSVLDFDFLSDLVVVYLGWILALHRNFYLFFLSPLRKENCFLIRSVL